MNGHDLASAVVGQIIAIVLLAGLFGVIVGSMAVLTVWWFS